MGLANPVKSDHVVIAFLCVVFNSEPTRVAARVWELFSESNCREACEHRGFLASLREEAGLI